jgi:SAM-dependent methyltransferase
MDDRQQQREHFEAVSERYFSARQNENHLLLKKLLWDDFLAGKESILPQDGDVLEAMCGYSEGKSILESRFPVRFRYSGFDYSRPLVDKARERFPEARIFVADATQFDEVDSCDLIILIGGLHHVYRHTDEVLARLHRALRPGGHFINFEPTQDNFLFRKIRQRIYDRNALFDADTERAYELGDLNAAYRRAGFTIRDQVYPGLLSYVLYYNPDAFPRLNLGGPRCVKAAFALDRPFFRSAIGRYFSFATLSLLAKASGDAR